MKLIFQYLTGGGGALSNIILLLQAYARVYADDEIAIVCSPNSGLTELASLPNVAILPFGGTFNQEVDRLNLGYWGLRSIAKKVRADLVWSLNLGSYVRLGVPSIISVNNSHQVYPWSVTRYHPESAFHVAALRWFFRKSLLKSDGVIVQTPVMKDLVSMLEEAPRRICVVPKSVEDARDLLSTPLPPVIGYLLDSGLGRAAFTFLYVATYVPHKNHRTLIDTFDRLSVGGELVRLVLTLTAEEVIAIGGEVASRLLNSGHLVAVGWAKKEFLRALYDSCDACLMPSVLESLSSANLEAMQWMKPQIVSDLPFARDLCGEAAVYASAQDSREWFEKIRTLVSDRALQAELVTKGRDRMKSFPDTWDEAAQRVHRFFKSVLNEMPST